MSKRINEKFLAAYIELDMLCGEKFNVAEGGIAEYINRLNNARIAPGREDTLPRLVKYRTVRNMIAHEVGALRRDNGVSRADVKWLKKFSTKIKRKNDPISMYLRKARRYLRFRKARRIAVWTAFILLVLLIITLIVFRIIR